MNFQHHLHNSETIYNIIVNVQGKYICVLLLYYKAG